MNGDDAAAAVAAAGGGAVYDGDDDNSSAAWSVCMYVGRCMYVFRLSHSCTLLMPLYGTRCHLAG